MDNQSTTILAIVAVISALSAFAVSVCRYIKHSECWGASLDTRDTPLQTPLKKSSENTPLKNISNV